MVGGSGEGIGIVGSSGQRNRFAGKHKTDDSVNERVRGSRPPLPLKARRLSLTSSLSPKA